MTHVKKQARKCELKPVHCFLLLRTRKSDPRGQIPHTKGQGSIDSTVVSKREGPIKPMKLKDTWHKTRGQVTRIPLSGVTKILPEA
ncbi:LOW QUALITY PROTEIN: hypothetical protein TorRG33x02_021380 [Trema orientale]|uniref:Uncharacterized protein n=1 Tax=Trema orientale TaxID=63057 RepID=A0A2P5FX54_TREOI|nr:LOW QUALITY PROTEIN: hypothetical protein TorRG33x02_021380 [Trema orientale]